MKLTTLPVERPGKIGRFDVKIKDKTPLYAKKGRYLDSGNTVPREAFAGTRESLNELQVKFNCREGNKGGLFL